jgi:hypothetical protein
MQRITWSGVAMHAGVLPGHPASHGCIRMPMAFAVKMYGWTKMGARVIVTPGELTPEPFSHPLLVTQKVVPQPVAADVPKPDAAAKGDRAADADPKATAPEPKLELRPTVGHDSQMSAVMNEPAAPAPLSEQTHTADAGTSPGAKMTITMSDAMASVPQAADNAATAPATEHADNAGTFAAEPKSDSAPSAVEPVTAEVTDKITEAASSDDKPVEANALEVKAAETATPEAKPAEIATTDQAGPAKVGAVKADDKASDKPADVTAATTAPAAAVDASKDQGRLSDPEKPAAPAKPALAMAKGSGPISVFISRKDNKLYVRQNFAPLFDVPVAIAPSDRPLGTHIFTAEADRTDSNILHWSVVTLPASRKAERREDDERGARHRKMAGAVEIAKPVPVPDSAAEALDRISIPADAMARITDALSTGGSIIVSDQGIAAGETGEGTDFIVSLR